MRKILNIWLVILSGILLTGCYGDDIETLQEDMAAITARVEALELWKNETNSNIAAIQTILKALEAKDYVESVTPLADGSGYVINFTKSGTVTIYHGKKGADGYTPQISIKKDSDGIYYWTLDGEWMTDNNGNKIPTTGEKGDAGEQGDKGDKGEDGITPQLKIEEDYWYISYDNGANWTRLGKATGEDGADGNSGSNGDSMFAKNGVDASNPNYVVFTLSDGKTTFTLPCTVSVSISFAEANNTKYNCTVVKNEKKYTINVYFKGLTDYAGVYAELMKEDGDKVVSIQTKGTTSAIEKVTITKPTNDNESGQLYSTVTFSEYSSTKITEEKAILKITVIDNNGREMSSTCILTLWNGEATDQAPNSTNTEWTVATAAEWLYLAKNGADGKNIKLAANIDFGGYSVTPIYNIGGFDGQGYTMSNLELLSYGGGYSTGLFQTTFTDVLVKNVTIENVKAMNATKEHGWIGTVFGDVQNALTITLNGVHIKNANLRGVKCVAGLVGFVASGCTLNVANCSVDGSYFHNFPVADESGYVAGLVGRPAGNVNVTNSTVTNTIIDAYYGAPDRTAETIQPLVGGKPELTAGSDVKIIKRSLEGYHVVIANNDELKTTTLDNGYKVFLGSGTYTLPSSAAGKTLTFVGSGANTIITPEQGQGLSGSTLNFENVTVAVAANASYTGFQHIAGATYKDCIIEGQIFLYGPSTFRDCTFNNTGDNYNVWTYGTSSEFIGCTFNCDAKAVLIYTEGAVTAEYTFDKCTFNDSEKRNEQKAAIEIGESAYGNEANYTVKINDYEVNGFAVTKQNASTFGGTNLGTTLWGNKNLIPADRLHIWIDGTEVY